MTIQTLKAISLKRIAGTFKQPEKGATSWLVLICGVITDAQTKVKDTGVHRVYSGDFLAKSLVQGKDGEYTAGRSSELHVPPVAERLLDDAEVGAPGTFANFVLKIGVTSDAKGRAEFVAEYVLAPEMSSPAEALAAKHAPEILGASEADTAKSAPAATPAPAKGKGK